MTIDATFWVAIAFIIFITVLVYLKVPQKINSLLNIMIEDIKNELNEAEKLKKESKNLLNESQEKLENSQKENEQIIKNDFEYISNKLSISVDELQGYMDMEKKTYKDYKSQNSIYHIGAITMRLLGIERGGKR